jgi:membrane associated rhomboid family serine protease
MRVAIVLSLICGLLAGAPGEAVNWLSLDRHALLSGELWRLWTGHLVHFSAMHAAEDIMLLFVVTAIAEREIGGRETAIALLVGAPLISLGLILLVPDLARYEGSSGLSALLGFIAGTLIWRRSPHLRFAIGCIGLAVIAKTSLDAAGFLAGYASVPAGVRIAWQAHVIAWAIAAASLALGAQARIKSREQGARP